MAELTHFIVQGEAHMVDIGDKAETYAEPASRWKPWRPYRSLYLRFMICAKP